MRVRREQAAVQAGADYTSTFVAEPVTAGDARAWAVSVFGGAPSWFGLVMRLGWRHGLGLRLTGAPDLAGWPVVDTASDSASDTASDSASDTVRMQATSRLVDAANIVSREGDQLRWTTVVGYRTTAGRIGWTLAALAHHHTLPWLIRRAARRTAPTA